MMRSSSVIAIRPSYSNATTAYAARAPLSTSGVRGSGISTTCRAASTPGHCSSILPYRATNVRRQTEARVDNVPLLIDFATPSSVFREQNRVSMLRIIGNGPPGTFVLFPNGLRVSLPTDQIVFADDAGGHARVGFGGMQFVGPEEGHL
jgi:hypothetical protein